MSAQGTCSWVMQHDEYASPVKCARPVKREGMCGIHARVFERRMEQEIVPNRRHPLGEVWLSCPCCPDPDGWSS